ncbi:MAG: hypothetical protein M3347_12035 [Armatimonadota bacterium]|nr:hypothetical protein [Armatimonadota bacterium]
MASLEGQNRSQNRSQTQSQTQPNMNDPDTVQNGARERRRKLRITGSFPALVRGVDSGGRKFEEEIKLRYISADGTALRLACSVELNARLFIVFCIWSAPQVGLAPRIAVHGVARSVERQVDGSYIVGVEFLRHRFLDPFSFE